mmetsp:Transcript_18993/g.57443  ORF Transcript_18993/g.57443 Transcript_18993/m.57443 type:complete len:213 (-) Transcript_18993:2019-2657(-)
MYPPVGEPLLACHLHTNGCRHIWNNVINRHLQHDEGVFKHHDNHEDFEGAYFRVVAREHVSGIGNNEQVGCEAEVHKKAENLTPSADTLTLGRSRNAPRDLEDLDGVKPHFDEIVEERHCGSSGPCRGKHDDVAKLNGQLIELIERRREPLLDRLELRTLELSAYLVNELVLIVLGSLRFCKWLTLPHFLVNLPALTLLSLGVGLSAGGDRC